MSFIVFSDIEAVFSSINCLNACSPLVFVVTLIIPVFVSRLYSTEGTESRSRLQNLCKYLMCFLGRGRSVWVIWASSDILDTFSRTWLTTSPWPAITNVFSVVETWSSECSFLTVSRYSRMSNLAWLGKFCLSSLKSLRWLRKTLLMLSSQLDISPDPGRGLMLINFPFVSSCIDALAWTSSSSLFNSPKVRWRKIPFSLLTFSFWTPQTYFVDGGEATSVCDFWATLASVWSFCWCSSCGSSMNG